MQTTSLKGLFNNYPLATLIVTFSIVLFSISQIINLVKPKIPIYEGSDNAYMSNYSAMRASADHPDLRYKGFIEEFSTKFPNQVNMATDNYFNSNVGKLAEGARGNEIRLTLLESKVENLQFEMNRITESQSEPLIYKVAFYFWAFIAWMGSIVISRILEHLTDQFHNSYFPQTKHRNEQ